MKKFLLIPVLFFCCITAYGQSISLIDLTNLTSLNRQQIIDYFVAGRVFKLQDGQEVNGFLVEQYQTNASPSKKEAVFVGGGHKLGGGDILYTASYTTSDPQNIINMINQTKNAGLRLTFQGADRADNIYIYDSFLYHVTIRLSFNQTKGTIDVMQKIALSKS